MVFVYPKYSSAIESQQDDFAFESSSNRLSLPSSGTNLTVPRTMNDTTPVSNFNSIIFFSSE